MDFNQVKFLIINYLQLIDIMIFRTFLPIDFFGNFLNSLTFP